MVKRKIIEEEYEPDEPPVLISKKKKKIMKFEELPEIKSLDDLISVAETSKWYRNINNLMLWDILPFLKELQSMIGMISVKQSIFHQILYYIQGLHERNLDGDYLHTIITGKPGSGKTTVAKIIGKIYQYIGVLPGGSNKFKISSREDFVGEYLGSTAVKTKKLLNSCIGGCLFVDELYSLGPGQKDKDSYSKEAIDTINLFLSEHKNDFVFIGAGYKEDIDKCFFSVNQGLKRRFQWIHNIDDYNTEDLSLIFLKMIKDINWNINLQIEEIRKLFNENKELLKDGGGTIENLLSKIKLCHSIRVFGKEEEFKFIITKEDIIEGFLMLKKYDTKKERNITLDYYI